MDGQNPFRTTLKPRLKPMLVSICRGIINPGFLRWCRILSRSHRTWDSPNPGSVRRKQGILHDYFIPVRDLFWGVTELEPGPENQASHGLSQMLMSGLNSKRTLAHNPREKARVYTLPTAAYLVKLLAPGRPWQAISVHAIHASKPTSCFYWLHVAGARGLEFPSTVVLVVFFSHGPHLRNP